MIKTGDTFLSRTPDYDTEHLYIIISIINNGTEALFVNVTTKKAHSDTSCVLTAGDHEFIIHESIINYGDATIAKIDNLERAIDQNIIKPHQSVSDELLKRILKGATNSEAFPQGYLEHLDL